MGFKTKRIPTVTTVTRMWEEFLLSCKLIATYSFQAKEVTSPSRGIVPEAVRPACKHGLIALTSWGYALIGSIAIIVTVHSTLKRSF